MIIKKLFVLLFSALVMNLMAQENYPWAEMAELENADYETIVENADAFYETTPSAKSASGSTYKKYLRWKTFWENRVQKGENYASDFDAFKEALINKMAVGTPLVNGSAASNWQFLGPLGLTTQNLGVIVSLAIDPTNTDVIYAGTNASGLWKTTNGGDNWFNITDQVNITTFGVEWIALDPADPDIIYIATGTGYKRKNGIGVLKSTNGGDTWDQTGLGFEPNNKTDVKKILINPDNTDILYALVNDMIYRSFDAGDNWEIIFENKLTNWLSYRKDLRDIEFHPDNSDILFVSSEGYKTWITPDYPVVEYYPAELWKTENANNATPIWTKLNITSDYTENIAIATTPDDLNSIYVSYRVSDDFIIDKTDDIGNSWSNELASAVGSGYGTGVFSGTGIWLLDFEISPTDHDVFYISGWGTDRVINSTNNIFHYSASTLSTTYHIDTRALCFVDGSTAGTQGANDVLLVGNDGGVTTLNGNAKTNNNGSGLNITQFYGMANSELSTNLIFGGTQDNGVFTHNSNWLVTIVGDGGECVADRIDPDIAYCSGWGPSPRIWKTSDEGKNWNLNSQPSGVLSTVRPMYIDKDNKFYIGNHDVFVLNSTTNTWDQLSDFTSSHSVTASSALKFITVSEYNTDIIYAAYPGAVWSSDASNHVNRLFKTTNGGSTWVDLSASIGSCISWSGITSIALDAENPNNVWVSFANFRGSFGNGNHRVAYSSDGGTTWTDISEGLDYYPVNKIVHVDGSELNDLFVATDIGVFHKNNNINWEPFITNMPMCIVSDVEVHYSTNKIRAATFGRGIWESEIDLPQKEITTNTVYNSDVRFANDIIIKSPNTLTINAGSKITIPVGGKIAIEQGAELIINGGTITNLCGENWEGIDVFGTMIYNSGTIENFDNLTVSGILNIDNDDLFENVGSGLFVVQNGGNLIIETSNTLTLNSGNDINIANNGNLTVNGSLVFNGGTITGYGAGTLHLNGSMSVNASESVTLKCNINLNGNITGGSGSSLFLDQASVTSGTLAVTGARSISNFSTVVLDYYDIAMQNTSSGLDIINCPGATLSNLSVSGTAGHRGLEFNNSPDATISNCTFQDGFKGLTLNSSERVEIYGSALYNNTIGLFSYNSSYLIASTDIEANASVGIWTNDNSGSSYIYDSYINNNGGAGPFVDYSYGGPIGGTSYQGGLVVDGYVLGTLYLTNVGMYANQTQAINLKESYAKLNCLNAEQNQYGVVLESSAVESAQSLYVDSEYAFYGLYNGTNGNSLDLYMGENNLSNNQMCIFGEFAFIGKYGYTPVGTHYADANMWLNPGSSPVSGYDYWLTTGGTIYDYNPISSFNPVCGYVVPNFKSATLSTSVVEETLSLEQQLKEYKENYKHLMKKQKYEANDSSYAYMKLLMSDLIYKIHDKDSTKTLAKMLLKVQKKRFRSNAHTKDEFVNLCIDASKTLNYLGNYDKAIAVLDSAKTLVSLEKQERLDRGICKISAKRDYLNSNGAMDVMEALGACAESGQKSGQLLNSKERDFSLTDVELSITPNPVTGISTIELCVPDIYLSSEIRIMDTSGKLLINQYLNKNTTQIEVSKSDISQGVYLVSVHNNGKVIASKKMVVIK